MAYERHRQYSIVDWIINHNLDSEHKLRKLSQRIEWDRITEKLSKYYSPKGRKAKRIRMMVGLHMLKHLYNLSDEQVVEGLRENIYWMMFCGVPTEEIATTKPLRWIDASTMTRFRKRIGAEGMKEVEAVIREQLRRGHNLSPRVMVADTTCMEKHIHYPTDSGLLDKGRRKLIKVIKRLQEKGVVIKGSLRSYSRVSKKALVEVNKFGRGTLERIEKPLKRLSHYAEAVLSKVPGVLQEAKALFEKENGEQVKRLCKELTRTAQAVQKVIRQTEARLSGIHVSDKVYSVHEPEVASITRGKRSKVHEYGCKVSIAIDRKGYVVTHEEYPDNRHDNECLPEAIQDWKEACGRLPEVLSADRGYGYKEGKEPAELLGIPKVVIPRKGKRKAKGEGSWWFRKYKRMRSMIEAVISHLKQDYGMNRCRYRGFEGDHINVSLAMVAWNVKKWVMDTG